MIEGKYRDVDRRIQARLGSGMKWLMAQESRESITPGPVAGKRVHSRR
jgi:hypothetical protein